MNRLACGVHDDARGLLREQRPEARPLQGGQLGTIHSGIYLARLGWMVGSWSPEGEERGMGKNIRTPPTEPI
jgi:hypothetical protein